MREWYKLTAEQVRTLRPWTRVRVCTKDLDGRVNWVDTLIKDTSRTKILEYVGPNLSVMRIPIKRLNGKTRYYLVHGAELPKDLRYELILESACAKEDLNGQL